MNVLGAFLLIFMNEENSFWMLATICEDLQQGYYVKVFFLQEYIYPTDNNLSVFSRVGHDRLVGGSIHSGGTCWTEDVAIE
jgi:hypothetical protein